MRTKHRFRPSGEWALEDRIALSHAPAVAELALPPAPTQALRATFQGRYVAIPPQGLGGQTQAILTGTSRIPGLGNVRLSATLTANPSLAPSATNTRAVFNLTSPRAGGTLTSVATGPTTDLTARTPTTTQLNYTVIAAPPKLSSFIGTHGIATLTLRPRLRNLPPGGNQNGQFTLRVVQS
jgi:hypothetical protein